MLKNKKQNIIYSSILIVYAIFTLVLVLHHEVWRDEAQVWLVARDLDILGVIKHVRTEGHPLLWYFLVMPLTKLIHGFNAVFSMQILNWLFVVAGVGIFLFKSPFNFFLKISVILSSGFLYWYPVIARSYCLIPFLMFLLATLYKKQKEHPFVYAGLLIALANTHVIMFGFCSALALIFAWNFRDYFKKFSKGDKNEMVNNKFHLVAPSLVFVTLISIVLYLWGSHQENCMVDSTISFLAFPTLESGITGYSNIFTCIICYFTLILGGIIFYMYNKKIFFAFYSNVLFQLFVYCCIWNTIIPQRIYTLFWALIFCFWLTYNEIKLKTLKILLSTLLGVLFITSIPNFLSYASFDYKQEFSQGKKIAKYIVKNIDTNTLLVSNNIFATTAISAYLPKNRKFYNMNNQVFYTYSIWNNKFPQEKTNITPKSFLFITANIKNYFDKPETMEKFEIEEYNKGYVNGNNQE